MAERADQRKFRVIAAWNGARYSPPASDPTAPPRPLLTAPVSQFPLVEAGHRLESSGPLDRSGATLSPSRPVPNLSSDASRPPGLYDLPTLLARIWSVPAAQVSSGSSYSPRPELRPPEPREIEFQRGVPVPPEPTPSSLASWPSYARKDDSSLPLAAVPSLTLVTPKNEAGALPVPPRSDATPPPSYVPSIQYVAWRRPPCRLPYDAIFPRGIHGARPFPVTIPASAAAPAHPPRTESLIRPASPAWMLPRYDSEVDLA